MNDPVLRHLLWARRRERSPLRRLLWRRVPLLDAGVADRVETVWARAIVRSQHERVRREGREAPASAESSLDWDDEVEPDRPEEGVFDEGEEHFNLASTRSRRTCGTCGGSGRVPCGACGGSGRTFCEKGPSCPRCKAGELVRCKACGGRGLGACARCEGEGILLDWTVEIWSWTVHQQQVEVPAVGAPTAAERRAEAALARRPADAVPSFEASALRSRVERLGADALAVAAEAARQTAAAEARAASLDGRCLHLHTERWLLPTRSLTCRTGGIGTRHLLLGGGASPVEVGAPPSPDPAKILGWALLMPALAAAALAVHLPLAAGVAATLAGVGLLVLVLGWARAGGPATRVILVVPARGPTRYLPLLAHAGARLGRIDVPDDLESALLEGLRGEDHTPLCAALVVAPPGGPRLRLLELRGAEPRTAEALAEVIGAADGVLLVPEDREAPRIARARAVAARLGRPVATLPGGSAWVSALAEGWLASRGAGSEEVFARLWAPVRELEAAWSREAR